MKVLIVDDNSQMREMIAFFLRDFAKEIRECGDGAEALAAYTDFSPDWVLMDWEMKELDGLAATNQIVSSFPDAQIVMVTQYDDAELRQAADQAGARGFISKDNLQALHQLLLQ